MSLFCPLLRAREWRVSCATSEWCIEGAMCAHNAQSVTRLFWFGMESKSGCYLSIIITTYRNASNKRPGAHLFSKLWGGRLFERGAYSRGALTYIIVSIIHEIHKCNMQKFCYILPFTINFYAQMQYEITTKLSIAYLYTHNVLLIWIYVLNLNRFPF